MAQRKRKSSAAGADDSQVKRKTPASANEPRRRSQRQRDIQDIKVMADAGTCLWPLPPADNRKIPEDVDKERRRAKEGVRTAMEELGGLETRLANANKRQRTFVEDSHPVVSGQEFEATRYRAQNLHRGAKKEVVNDRPEIKDEPRPASAETLEAAPMAYDKAAEAAEDVNAAEDKIDAEAEDDPQQKGASRPPAVNSDYLPLPWKGRLGYACLNTYLRNAKPPVFSSRTCRIASILLHQHPLADPTLPEHATKNRPDSSKPKDVRLGEQYIENLGLANARDIVKMLRWNDKYGIKFMRLSSEMFPFASHPEYGYQLAPFASEALAEAGAVAGELGHRLTTHPGQFTQLGSPRKEVVTAAVRDLEYHDEMLTLLKLPPQQDRDAVMILHMGGTFGDKAATLDRFRKNYATLSESVKRRLVLENDDVGWSVHDLLPVCEELDIPLVLDFHHHNIVFDADKMREGTYDIMELFPRIKATWDRKNIKQKMHYSESRPEAVTPHHRRKHSARVRTLPPCPPDMDLMIEAKDKEQAVFELMRAFKLPGHELAAEVVPYEREDESRPKRGGGGGGTAKGPVKKKTPQKKTKAGGRGKGVKQEEEDPDGPFHMNGDGDGDTTTPEDECSRRSAANGPEEISPEEFGMGGRLGRVYWPEGMEEWLKPQKKTANRLKTTKITKEEDEDES